MVPNVSLAVINGDPAQAMFNTTNFPGASQAQLSQAQSLYALVTGRVSQIGRASCRERV